jgi:hypothetical protein
MHSSEAVGSSQINLFEYVNVLPSTFRKAVTCPINKHRLTSIFYHITNFDDELSQKKSGTQYLIL